MAAPKRARTPVEVAAMVVIGIFFFLITVSLIPPAPKDVETNFCPQVEPIDPQKVAPELAKSSQFLKPKYASKSVKYLQGAVKIPTEIVRDMHDINEDRFLPFMELQTYLTKTFPRAAEKLQVVNKYGLLYNFEGHGPGTLLISHQDVVPAGNASKWEYPPFDGHFDGKFLHGRGSCDAKNNMIAILEAVESLLAQDWQPSSPLVLAFGFDQEIGGKLGGSKLAEFIHEQYGHESFKIILDEGQGVDKMYGSMVAFTGVEEKGAVNIGLDLQVPGGHSSAPPDHTGIGIMARLIRKLDKNAHDSLLPDDNPVIQMYRCVAEHSPHMPKETKRDVLNPTSYKDAVRVIKNDPEIRDFIRTIHNVDYVHGGSKVNALPELVSVEINHRVSVDSSTAAVIDRVEHFVLQNAGQFDLQVWSQNELLRDGGYGNISISVSNRIEPSHVSPYSGFTWDVLSGTTKHVFGSVTTVPGEVIVVPSISGITTDSHYYWHLTRSIYRFTPGYQADQVNRHSTNEKIEFRSHLIAVAWYYEFIINMTL